MAKAVIGVFRSEDRAREAIDELKRNGFDEREISLVAKDNKGQEIGAIRTRTTLNNGRSEPE